MAIRELLAKPAVTLLMPPKRLYQGTILLLFIISWTIVVCSLWQGQHGMALLHWVGLIFAGMVALLVSLPKSWQAWRLAELGWDEQQLYLVNGQQDRLLAVSRSQLKSFTLERSVGHDGQWLDFSLDIVLGADELEQIVELLVLEASAVHQVSEGIYRFGFKRAWHRKAALAAKLAPLLSSMSAHR